MKKNKWLKWKIGAAVSLGLGLLFNEVRSSAAFAAKVQAVGSGGGAKPNAAADAGQSDPFAYRGGDGPSSGQSSGTPRRGTRHRSGAKSDLGGGDGSAPSSGSDSGSGTSSGTGSYSNPAVPSSPAVPNTRTHTITGRS